MKELDFKIMGSRIKERRVFMGMTQEKIADFLDVNPSHISNIECGRAKPSLTALVNIANMLECSVDYFIVEEYNYEPRKDFEKMLDRKIMDKLKSCNIDKKERILKMIDLL